MQHQNQDESGEKNTAVRLNKEIVLPTTDTQRLILQRVVSFGVEPPKLRTGHTRLNQQNFRRNRVCWLSDGGRGDLEQECVLTRAYLGYNCLHSGTLCQSSSITTTLT